MSFETFKTCLNKMPANLMLDFSGFAEPFLNQYTVKMLLYANEIHREMRLYTTFVGMTMEAFYQIADIPFKRVVVHLPDVNKYANIPMTKEYLQVLRYAAERNKPDGTPFIDMANCQSEPHPDAAAILKDRVTISWNLIDRAGNLDGGEVSSQQRKDGEIYCGRAAELNHTVLLPSGDVVLCCMDYGLAHVLGNLLHEPYDVIMHGTEMQRVRSALKNGGDVLCRHCTAAKRIPI